jgi:hypothetical protein
MADAGTPDDRDVQRLPSSEGPAESREETLKRVLEEEDAVEVSRERVDADPSTARGYQRTLLSRIPRFGLLGAGVGVLIGLLLIWGPGPLDAPLVGGPGRGTVTTLAGSIGFLVLCAVVFGLVFAALSGLIYNAREDGRTERRVEEDTGVDPGPPARGLDAKHDV